MLKKAKKRSLIRPLIRIHIWVLPWSIPHPSIKFHENPSSGFLSDWNTSQSQTINPPPPPLLQQLLRVQLLRARCPRCWSWRSWSPPSPVASLWSAPASSSVRDSCSSVCSRCPPPSTGCEHSWTRRNRNTPLISVGSECPLAVCRVREGVGRTFRMLAQSEASTYEHFD